eukprot:COSAG01_NODE_5028_length_4537_cov_4.829428_1_plen_168_part_00
MCARKPGAPPRPACDRTQVLTRVQVLRPVHFPGHQRDGVVGVHGSSYTRALGLRSSRPSLLAACTCVLGRCGCAGHGTAPFAGRQFQPIKMSFMSIVSQPASRRIWTSGLSSPVRRSILLVRRSWTTGVSSPCHFIETSILRLQSFYEIFPILALFASFRRRSPIWP